ncbi:hypothetical protein JCM5296_006211 [Sporobolomyces johnsonii]
MKYLRAPQGLYDLQHPPPPPPSLPSAPSQLNPPFYNPPYTPPPAPDESLRQRTVDKLDLYRDSVAVPVESESARRPPRPKMSSLRLRDKRTAIPSPLRTPPAMPSVAVPVEPDSARRPPRPKMSSRRLKNKRTVVPSPLPTPPALPPALFIKPFSALNSSAAPSSFSTRLFSAPPSSTKAFAALPASCSLIQHPFCREIVSECREVFDTTAASLGIFDEDRLVFLASSGAEQSFESIPRHQSFSAHMVLNRHRGFVVLDAAQDWRFANNFFTVKHGVVFYAGFPITLPTDLRNADSPRVAIGSLCLTDKLPRSEFTNEDRQELARLATKASLSIEEWARARLANKITQLDAGFDAWQREVELAHSTPSSLSPRSQHVLDLSTRSIASQLDLPLVYVISLSPPPASDASSPPPATSMPMPLPRVRLLSCSGPPSHPLGFSVDLHVKALQAPEGGLVYENPTPSRAAWSYSGGIVLAVASEARSRGIEEGMEGDGGTRGCVLAVFKREKKRVFGKEELLYLRRFAEALGEYVEEL